jgi:hypothetical protein
MPDERAPRTLTLPGSPYPDGTARHAGAAADEAQAGPARPLAVGDGHDVCDTAGAEFRTRSTGRTNAHGPCGGVLSAISMKPRIGIGYNRRFAALHSYGMSCMAARGIRAAIPGSTSPLSDRAMKSPEHAHRRARPGIATRPLFSFIPLRIRPTGERAMRRARTTARTKAAAGSASADTRPTGRPSRTGRAGRAWCGRSPCPVMGAECRPEHTPSGPVPRRSLVH